MIFTELNGAVIFNVRVVPRASKSEIVGEIADALKIRIAAPPIDNRANVELAKVLARFFGVSKSRIQIVSGETSRAKQIKITNFSGGDFQLRLASEKRA